MGRLGSDCLCHPEGSGPIATCSGSFVGCRWDTTWPNVDLPKSEGAAEAESPREKHMGALVRTSWSDKEEPADVAYYSHRQTRFHGFIHQQADLYFPTPHRREHARPPGDHSLYRK